MYIKYIFTTEKKHFYLTSLQATVKLREEKFYKIKTSQYIVLRLYKQHY